MCYTCSMDWTDTSSITALISHIHSAASCFLKVRLQSYGLPDTASSHGNILFRLSQSGRLSMGELAKLVNRDKSTITVLVRKLETAGYVKRESGTEDSRVTYITLSDTGREYTDKMALISKELTETCCSGFSEQEKQTVFVLLNKIASNFEKQLPG